jgi:hypothetical protein
VVSLISTAAELDHGLAIGAPLAVRPLRECAFRTFGVK